MKALAGMDASLASLGRAIGTAIRQNDKKAVKQLLRIRGSILETAPAQTAPQTPAPATPAPAPAQK